jgi:hypothetical protein
MNTGRFAMRSLLEQAGFRVRSGTRADCIHCEGHLRATVSFTDEVAFCHRCKWRANSLFLARQLGLVQGNLQAAFAFRGGARRRACLDSKVKRFDAWRERWIREVSNRYRALSRAAIKASDVLARFPGSEEAWEALARYYHAVAQLSATFDWLMFTKASEWLENDSSSVEVFEAWRRHAA